MVGAESYGRYLDGKYLPAYSRSALGIGGENMEGLRLNNKLTNDPDSWVKSSDVTVSTPVTNVAKPTKENPKPEPKHIGLWSAEGILSGEYDKLTPELKQWYLHTHGTIKN